VGGTVSFNEREREREGYRVRVIEERERERGEERLEKGLGKKEFLMVYIRKRSKKT